MARISEKSPTAVLDGITQPGVKVQAKGREPQLTEYTSRCGPRKVGFHLRSAWAPNKGRHFGSRRHSVMNLRYSKPSGKQKSLAI